MQSRKFFALWEHIFCRALSTAVNFIKRSEKCLPTYKAISSMSETFCFVHPFCRQEVLTGCFLFISGLSHHQSSSVALQPGKKCLFLVLHRILSLRQATSARFSLSVMNKPTVEEQIYCLHLHDTSTVKTLHVFLLQKYKIDQRTSGFLCHNVN